MRSKAARGIGRAESVQKQLATVYKLTAQMWWVKQLMRVSLKQRHWQHLLEQHTCHSCQNVEAYFYGWRFFVANLQCVHTDVSMPTAARTLAEKQITAIRMND